MGTYGEKGRATANHKSSKRRNLQNRAWHTKKQARGKQNITWDQIKRHKYKVTDTMSDHYYRWHMLNRTECFMEKKKSWCNSLYIFTLPINLSTLYKNTFYFSLEEHTSWLRNTVHFTAHKMLYVCKCVQNYVLRTICVSYMYIYSLVDSEYWVTVNCVNLTLWFLGVHKNAKCM